MLTAGRTCSADDRVGQRAGDFGAAKCLVIRFLMRLLPLHDVPAVPPALQAS
jgi:hypothetical protein